MDVTPGQPPLRLAGYGWTVRTTCKNSDSVRYCDCYAVWKSCIAVSSAACRETNGDHPCIPLMLMSFFWNCLYFSCLPFREVVQSCKTPTYRSRTQHILQVIGIPNALFLLCVCVFFVSTCVQLTFASLMMIEA